jgi:hypothetical protein
MSKKLIFVCLAIAAAAWSLPAYADLFQDPTSGLYYYSTANLTAWNFPSEVQYASLAVPSAAGTSQGYPGLGKGATYQVLAETFTPQVSFTLTNIEITAGGGGGGMLIMNIFPITPSISNTSASATYPAPAAGSGLLGNGNGLSFPFPGYSGEQVVTFDLTNGNNSDDQIALTAGQQYALEFWEGSASTLFWDRSGTADPYGQAFGTADSTTARTTLNALGLAGGAPRTFGLSLTPEPATICLLALGSLALLRRKRT